MIDQKPVIRHNYFSISGLLFFLLDFALDFSMKYPISYSVFWESCHRLLYRDKIIWNSRLGSYPIN